MPAAEKNGLAVWQKIFDEKAAELYRPADPSHDAGHIRRVVATATVLAREEGADMNVVLPAAYFHDFVNVPKNDPRRKEASRLSAAAAVEYLRVIGYPAQYFGAIAHAIAAHSFSAAIPCETVEAQVVQDADRLDALGAMGIARLFTVCGFMQRPYYHADEPLPENRPADDTAYAIDHFYVKLFRVAESLKTPAARRMGAKRADFMRQYLSQAVAEISGGA